LYCAIPLASWFLYVLTIGGDWTDLSRFFVVVIPTLIVCSMLSLFDFQRWARLVNIPSSIDKLSGNGYTYQRRPIWRESVYLSCFAVLVCTLFGIIFACRQAIARDMEYLKEDNTSLVMVARGLNKSHLADGSLIGVCWAGVVPYFMSDQKFHDVLGKSDRYIAHTQSKWGAPGHSKWDFDYSLNTVKPDVLITNAYSMLPMVDTKMRNDLKAKDEFSFRAVLWFHPTFISFYQPNQVHLIVDNTRPTGQDVYMRKE
jgi:hypothetical protein